MVNRLPEGKDITFFEVDKAINKIRAEVDPEAELIFGAIKDDNMNGKIRVSIVATSLDVNSVIKKRAIIQFSIFLIDHIKKKVYQQIYFLIKFRKITLQIHTELTL